MKKIIFLLAIAFCSCSKDPAIVPDYMDPQRFPLEIQPILKTFLKEGNKRGVYCDINKISKIVLVDYTLSDDGVYVNGYFDPNNKEIHIDTTSQDYHLKKEAIIFHELGHGLLNRVHKEGLWFGAFPYSIMAPDGELPQYEFNGFQYQRAYYIDELFHSDTPTPSWAD